MTTWVTRVARAPGPRYLAIANAIGEAIVEGELAGGSRLPPHRELAARLGVTVGTVSRAYAVAEHRGLIRGETGRGTYVLDSASEESLDPFPSLAAGPSLIDLSINTPVLEGGAEAVARGLERLASSPELGELLGYRACEGSRMHREAAATWLAGLDVEVEPERIVVTQGAQHALLVALLALCRPGDTVMTEALTYPGLKAIAAQHGLALHGLEMDDDGLMPRALAAACRAGVGRVLVTVPTVHNPTTSTLPVERRREIADIARDHGIHIVEDDVFRSFVPDAPPSLWRLAPERTLTVQSFSKCLLPALRIGYLSAPESHVKRVRETLSGTAPMSSPLMAQLAADWISDGTALALASRQRDEARGRQRLAERLLPRERYRAHPACSHGWLRLPPAWDGEAFVQQALSRGVKVLSEQAFSAGPQRTSGVRLCLGAARSLAELERGLRILAALLASPAPSQPPRV